jgi:hypothetical protein
MFRQIRISNLRIADRFGRIARCETSRACPNSCPGTVKALLRGLPVGPEFSSISQARSVTSVSGPGTLKLVGDVGLEPTTR